MESLCKGLAVLECFSSARPELRLVDICRESGLAPSTAHRVVAALVKAGYLQKTSAEKKYAIGLKAYTVGAIYLSYASSLIEATRPALDLLADLTRERVALHVLDHHYCVLIASRECPHPVRYTEPIGSRTLAHCSATGKAMLSGLDPDAFHALWPDDKLERLTQATIVSRTELLREVEHVRQFGVAINLGENFSDMFGVAAPVRNVRGRVVAGISIAGPSSRMSAALRSRLAILVRMAGHLASRHLGYLGPETSAVTAESIRSWWNTSTDLTDDQLQHLLVREGGAPAKE